MKGKIRFNKVIAISLLLLLLVVFIISFIVKPNLHKSVATKTKLNYDRKYETVSILGNSLVATSPVPSLNWNGDWGWEQPQEKKISPIF